MQLWEIIEVNDMMGIIDMDEFRQGDEEDEKTKL